MTTFVLLLKGINVGGHKKIPMADLRDLLTKSGFKNVKTYIQSGNVILQSTNKDIAKIESDITAAILKQFGFEVSVLVKTRHDLERIFNSSPFSEEKKKASYFIMLHKTPDADLVREASEKVYKGEEYEIINDCIYFFCEKGFGQAKFSANFFERKLNTFATARNYNTMLKLLSLSA
ncbi:MULTISPECIES: DUF1697 domain-containing protein [Bizionia]|uniref:DUF1697 domain-containing protein n=1 Tax=Bizionia algoritergicola TaxID=291187 RepID=A0A5D0QZN8_9FLAO|nr:MULTISPECIES: DUF1697 domain-containing protein [Bizionia]OBX23030.1 hypothetical protein BAA08_05680 [Bizionia sp. APA-3]TYB74687.1 DUF1697 domain-containing protein [Bizionia algoritergicola]